VLQIQSWKFNRNERNRSVAAGHVWWSACRVRPVWTGQELHWLCRLLYSSAAGYLLLLLDDIYNSTESLDHTAGVYRVAITSSVPLDFGFTSVHCSLKLASCTSADPPVHHCPV
jgi:hypothetical protein